MPAIGDRPPARTLVAVRAMAPREFVEIHVNCPLEICERRDPKGLYRRARAGEVRELTGIDSPYEPPLAPEVRINTAMMGIEEAVEKVLAYLQAK